MQGALQTPSQEDWVLLTMFYWKVTCSGGTAQLPSIRLAGFPQHVHTQCVQDLPVEPPGCLELLLGTAPLQSEARPRQILESPDQPATFETGLMS